MRTKIIDGKKVIYKSSSRNTPPISIIKKVYAKIPDNKRIPIVFETKEQYLNEYIKNQEKAKHTRFTPEQIRQYKHTELKGMKNVVSRYTTKNNPYIDLRTVFFTDKKIPKQQFAESAYHEYGHEIWEKNPKIRRDWQSVHRTTAPTSYGRTDRQEDFAESFMLAKSGIPIDPKRQHILQKDVGLSRHIHPSVRKLVRGGGASPEDYKAYEEGIRENPQLRKFIQKEEIPEETIRPTDTEKNMIWHQPLIDKFSKQQEDFSITDYDEEGYLASEIASEEPTLAESFGIPETNILSPATNPMIVGMPKYFDTRTLGSRDVGKNILTLIKKPMGDYGSYDDKIYSIRPFRDEWLAGVVDGSVQEYTDSILDKKHKHTLKHTPQEDMQDI